MKPNIALIGFMATGKTTVAKILAKKLGKKYVSTDALIVKKMKKSIPKIFKENGERRFREAEIEAVKETAKMKNVVIDCGGGVILNQINVDRLRQSSKIFLLTAKSSEILRRSLNKCDRPLLNVKNRAKRIKELLRIRKPLYEKSADFKIDTTKLTVNEVVEKIIKIIRSEGNGNSCKKK